MNHETYTCPYHNIEGLLALSPCEAEKQGIDIDDTCCPECVKEYKNLPHVDSMKPQEKADELNWWHDERGTSTIPFFWMRERFDQLVGRSVGTIEISCGRSGLVAEILEAEEPAVQDDENTENRKVRLILDNSKSETYIEYWADSHEINEALDEVTITLKGNSKQYLIRKDKNHE